MVQRATEIVLDAVGFPLPPDVVMPQRDNLQAINECAFWRRLGSILVL